MPSVSLTELISDKPGRAVSLFTAAEIEAVSALLSEKNGKTYIRCQVRKKKSSPSQKRPSGSFGFTA